MKNVLLPTDLTVQSLSAIHTVVKYANGEKVVIRLVHLLSLPTSISDLLFAEQQKPYAAVSEHFVEAYQMLQYKYRSSIEKIHFEFVYYSTSRYLNNYIEGNHIDEIYLLDNFSYMQPLQQSQNIDALFRKCKVPLIKVQLNTRGLSEFQTISALLAGDKIETTPAATPAKSAMSYS
jgi:hypothetical protein